MLWALLRSCLASASTLAEGRARKMLVIARALQRLNRPTGIVTAGAAVAIALK